ncbi:hypothetical protein U27_00635 [Candidatus Vecturithrix granuli]|uniref:Peptidase M42 family protein n=1 Tax=Vecturithrix granuli TaxID=1499967 RepID=A0A081C832_VECG1|nr:hypothetical protein U27_00635 [Candidatus Vecturithrix granuli]
MWKSRHIDPDALVECLETLLKIPSPTGYTKLIEQHLLSYAQERKIPVHHTRKGAVMYAFEYEHAAKNVMLTAHVDALGAIVKEVYYDTLKLSLIGGYPVLYLIGDYCQIHGFDGKIYEGTILPDNPAAHVNNKLNEFELKIENLSVRVDLPLNNGRESLAQYIEVGNFVSLDPKYRYLNGFIKSRHLDDKASGSILLYIADILNKLKVKLRSNIYFYFNITEETGQGIAGFPAIDDLLVVDMGVVGSGVRGDEFSVSICAKDSTGPYNYDLTQTLIQLSKKHQIDYKTDIFPYYGSDGSAALRAGGDMRVALIGPGVSASHGYERTHIDALINTTKLILHFLEEECSR